MATLRIHEPARTDAEKSDVLHSKWVLRQLGWTLGSSPTSDPVGTGPRMLRVLLVDEEQRSAATLVRQVRRWGHSCRVAQNGPAALRAAATERPNVVLLNLELQLMDGCQLARQLRLDDPRNDCLILAVTERVEDSRRKTCIEAGIDLLLHKPVDPEILETLLTLECVRVHRRGARKVENNPTFLRSTDHRSVYVWRKP